MSVPTKSREIRLAARPTGWPTPDDFAFAEEDLHAPADGEVLVRNTHMSVEPYMRGRMNDAKSYVPPFQLGKPLEGAAVGFVVDSKANALPAGTWVSSNLGWREYALAQADAFRPIDTSVATPSAYLGVLGVPGFTAWIGLNLIAKLRPQERLFVSSAAGAVGSIAGQLAKLAEATVVGSAGSAEKVSYLTNELHFDAAFDYHGGDVGRKLAAAAPDGIDVYFDNVGGEQLDAALLALRPFGRVAVCGMISGYNEAMPPLRNLIVMIPKRLTLRAFIVIDHMDRYADFVREVGPHVASGRIVAPETVYDGLDRAPQAFLDMLRGGAHLGKIVVRLAPDNAAA